MSDMLDMS